MRNPATKVDRKLVLSYVNMWKDQHTVYSSICFVKALCVFELTQADMPFPWNNTSAQLGRKKKTQNLYVEL